MLLAFAMIEYLLYAIAVGVMTLLAYMPQRPAYWFGARLGDLAYICLKRRRQVTLDNLALVLGEQTTPAQRQGLARAIFRRLGQHVMEFSRIRRLTPQRFRAVCEVEGREHLEALLQRQAGLLVIAAHFGSWELAPALALELSVPVHVIVRPPDHAVLRRLAAAHRQRCGFQAISSRHAFAPALRALRQGHIVAVLMDQSSPRHKGIPVAFLGASAYTSVGPALLALRTRCPVVGMFLVNIAPGRHRCIITPEIPLPDSGQVRQDVEEATRRFTAVIETYVRRYPDHWFWLHRRWKPR